MKSFVFVLFLISIMLFLLIPTTSYQAESVVAENSTIASRSTAFAVTNSLAVNKDVQYVPRYTLSTTTTAAIHVDGNWTETAAIYDWCTGSGAYNDPYAIRDLVIDVKEGGHGILIENTMEYFRIENCTVFNSGNTGITLYYVGNGTIIHNNVYGSYAWWEEEGDGIFVKDSSNITISNNRFTGNDRGILIFGSNNTVTENECSGNDCGISTGSNNTVTKNKCSGNDCGISTGSNNTVTENECIGNDCGISTGSNNTVTKNECIGNDYGISIGSNNIVIGNNCTGNSLSGIYLMTSHHNNIIKNNCTNNQGSSYNAGIYGKSSYYNTIIGNNCTGNSGSGIHFYWDSDYNNITRNTCLKNSNDGISLEMSYHNTVTKNNCTNNGNGIYSYGISAGGYNNTVTNNNCMNNGDGGILIGNPGHHTVTGNNCTGNSEDGIYFHFSRYNTVAKNNCTDNGKTGIYLWASECNNITKNTCARNSRDGIYLGNSDYNTITKNTCARNSRYGIYISSSNYNEIYSNSLIKNAEGCLYGFVEGNNIHNNTCVLILVASFNVNTINIATGQSVEFNDTTVGGMPLLVYQWNFGDGSANSTVQNPVHWYTSPGTHTVTLIVTDADGDISISDSIVISVRDTLPPVLDSPSDIIYEQGETGHNITWFVTDDNPYTYTIYKNDIEVASGVWTSGPITINVDGLLPGSYDYTVVVQDSLGNSAADTVIIIVREASDTEDTTTTLPTSIETTTENNTSLDNDDDANNPASTNTAFPFIASIIAIIVVALIALKRKR